MKRFQQTTRSAVARRKVTEAVSAERGGKWGWARGLWAAAKSRYSSLGDADEAAACHEREQQCQEMAIRLGEDDE